MLRGPAKGKCSGVLENVLAWPAADHPWFRRFAELLAPSARFRVVENRLFDLIPRRDRPSWAVPIGFETLGIGGAPGDAVTMIEFARDRGGIMPRVFAVNHHPEIVDRFRQVMILNQKRDRGEVTDEWYRERLEILTRYLPGRGRGPAPAPHLGLHAPRAAALPPLPPGAAARRVARAGPPASTRTGSSTPSLARRWPGAARPRCSEGAPMIPKPPFPEGPHAASRRSREFERLKPRLAEVWDSLTIQDEEPRTSVVVPSLTLDQSELRKIAGRSSFYEERLLFLLIRLRNPRARMVYVTSQPVHPIILEYYLQFLAGIPASHARARLTLLCADDDSPRSLTEKILDRPRLLERIRAGHHGPGTRLPHRLQLDRRHERKLAVLLGVPLERRDPSPHPPRHEVGEPEGLQRGGGCPCPSASRTCDTPKATSRTALDELSERDPGSGARWSSSTRASPARATRSTATPEFSRAALRDADAPAASSRFRRRLPRSTLDKFIEDGRDRRGVHGREGEALALAPSFGSALAAT